MNYQSGCIGFIAHSINPTRCRRCYKDISEHNQQQRKLSTDAIGLQPSTSSYSSSDKNFRRSQPQQRSASFSAASSSTKLDSSINDQQQTQQSVSFTLKPKSVKFSDNNNEKIIDNNNDESDEKNAGNENDPIDVAFTVCVGGKKSATQQQQQQQQTPAKNKSEQDYQSRIKELCIELTKSKEKIDLLESKNKELEDMKKVFSQKNQSINSNRQNFDEIIKLKQRINDMENEIKTLKNDKKSLEERIKRNNSSDNDTVSELKNKLMQSEKLVKQLTQENEDIKKDVKELEIEFQELHDNFREDQSSEFRVIKHELESMTKNCRILQFKLKKAEKNIEQLDNEKLDLQKQLNDILETSKMDVDKRKMKELENELSIAKEVSLKLHAEIEQLKEERMNFEQLQLLQQDHPNNNNNNNDTNKLSAPSSSSSTNETRKPSFGKLSPSPSFDQTTKDYEQVVRDLYDTMEREKDLQEQLKFSEEETRTMRKKLSTMEQENEILMLQIRKMTMKNNQTKDDEESESDELNPDEMKLHLELYEQEMIVLRRKTDELEQENENFQQEIKYLQDKLISQPITKVEIPEIPAGSPPNIIYDHKIKIIEAETRELRKKLIEKEKENESLRTEIELHRRRASKVINRTRSLDSEGQSLDMKKQLQLFEQEANILRQKLITLENDNEKLTNENKRLQLRISKKPPPGPVDQLQMENIELKDKIRELERKCDSLKTDLMNTKLNIETTETETDFIANLKKQLRNKENDNANLQSKLAQMDIEMAKINREYKKLKDSLNPRRRVNRVIRETATRLELKEIIKEMEDEIEHLQTNIRGKNAVIENLTEDISELKQRSSTNDIDKLSNNNNNTSNNQNYNNLNDMKNSQIDTNQLNDLKKRLEEEQHRTKSLQDKLDKLQQQMTDSNQQNKNKIIDNNINDDKLQQNNNERIINELKDKLKISKNIENELNTKINELKIELERVKNLNKQLFNDNDNNQSKTSGTNRLDEYRKTINELNTQLERQRNEFKEKEMKIRDELNQKVETTSKNIRKEVHLELQSLREESTNYKNRSNELQTKLEKSEKEIKELNEKLRLNQIQVRKEQNDSIEKIQGLENQLKTEQRKRERLEKEIENVGRNREEELLRSQEKIVQLEREIRRQQAKLDDVEYDYTQRLNSSEKELNRIKQDYDDLTNKYEMLEKDYVDLKSRSVTEKETLVEAVGSLKKSYEEKLNEIKTLKETSMSQRKEWYKEKLTLQERIADLESKLNKANLVEEERNRLKLLITEKENLLNSYRKEERIHNEERERNRIKMDSLQTRIAELERVERNARFMSITGRAQVDKELQDYRIRLEHSETSHKGELAALHAEYEGRMKLLGEEVEHLQQQMVHLAQERDKYRESLEKSKDQQQGTFKGTFRNEIEDLHSQLRIVRTDLEGALLENRNLKIQHGTEKSTWQIQLAEYKTQINQLEERILLETRGATRNYARTKMELAWEKERQENLRLLQDTQKFIQELRDKLIGVESLRDKERDEARRQLLELKTNMDKEHVETQQKIAELQFDLLALKEMHARLKSQNERYKRERAIFEKAKIDFIDNEIAELCKIADSVSSVSSPTKTSRLTVTQPNKTNTSNNQNEIVQAINQLKERLQSKYNEIMEETRATSQISISSNMNGRYTGGSSTSLASATNLPPPSHIKRAPPRLKLVKKSLSLDQQLRGASQERIWDSDRSLNSTPNSSVSNLRGRYGGGYESDSSGSGFFVPSSTLLRLRTNFSKDSSFTGGGSDSDTSAISSAEPKKKLTLKDKFKIRKSSKQVTSDDEQAIKEKLASYGFDKSPIELAKQREKKEKSLRYKISKTLSKTFSRSASVLSETLESNQSSRQQQHQQQQSTNRTRSPTRSKSPESKRTTSKKLHQETNPIVYQVPGVAQLKQKPMQKSNLAIPPSIVKHSNDTPPPKIKIYRTETNV